MCIRDSHCGPDPGRQPEPYYPGCPGVYRLSDQGCAGCHDRGYRPGNPGAPGWFQTGTPTFLVELLKKSEYDLRTLIDGVEPVLLRLWNIG